MTPQISVVIAVKNEQLHIQESIESVLSQEDVEIEVIVVDDGSSDATVDLVKRVAEADPRLRLLLNPGRGKVAAYNFGVASATGSWTCIFAGDDVMPAGSLKQRYDAVQEMGADGPLNGMCRLVTMSEDKRLDGQVIPRSPNKPTFSGVCYLMNKASVSMMWPIPEELPNEDTWLELAAQYLGIPFVCSPTIGCAWRIHPGNSINMLVPWDEFNPKITARMAANALFLEKYRDEVAPEARKILEARVRCEEARKRGDLIGILTSGVEPVAAVRAVSLSGPFFYTLRRKAYRLLSGW
jgi:glycosyltransferase involved in cell wall biosynthesis